MAVQALANLETGDSYVPKHVAIIMDGNGRWALQHRVSRSKGHRKGADAVKEAIEGAIDCGVQYLTLYAFSTENWNRPQDEVNDLMGLLKMYLKKEVRTLHKEGVRLRVIGRRAGLSPDIVTMIEKAEELTKNNQRITLVIALNYGAREEMITAMQDIARKAVNGDIAIGDIDESVIASTLFTRDIPDPDLIIRTSGEQRLSNFLLWQAAYSEFLFLPILWPDFTRAVFSEALNEFQKRERRFGARP